MNMLRTIIKILVLKRVRKIREKHHAGSSVEELCDYLGVIADYAVEEALSELESDGKVHSREDWDEETGWRWFPGTFEEEEEQQAEDEEEARLQD